MSIKPTVRTRILIPGDEAPAEDFYAERSGSEARQPLNNTALRRAERKYKTTNADLSGAFDFHDLSKNNAQVAEEIVLLGSWKSSNSTTRPVYGIKGVEGFVYVPGALTQAEQIYFMQQSFTAYAKPPNSTNLDAHYETPSDGFFPHFKAQTDVTLHKKVDDSRVVFKADEVESKIIRKIRWITLGYQYNWTTKEYNFNEADSAAVFPNDLARWIQSAVEVLGFGSDYRPEAGIVNFYQPEDTLTGHVDRSEKNMEAPLVSLSIGQSAIFLLGGKSREDAPVRAIIVRSGDLSILSGPSRHLFHGVPKILSESTFEAPQSVDEEDLKICLKLFENCRININVRQVV
jgi:alkylated DNA repair protein alkB family protein 1